MASVVCKWLPKYTAQVGDRIVTDTQRGGFTRELQEDKMTPGYSDSCFPGCQFRLEPGYCGERLAVNVKVTGHPHHLGGGWFKSRCRIEFVGDCEESTFVGGFVFHGTER